RLAEAVLSHHERWDGAGYPRGLRGRRIPLAARIVAIADAFDAVSQTRRYRHGEGARAALAVIVAGRGTQFDPELVDLTLLPPVRSQLGRPAMSRPSTRPNGRHVSAVPAVRFRWHGRRSRASPSLRRGAGACAVPAS